MPQERILRENKGRWLRAKPGRKEESASAHREGREETFFRPTEMLFKVPKPSCSLGFNILDLEEYTVI